MFTTLNVYAHSSEQMKRDAAKKIDEAIGTVLGADVTASDASCGDENGEGQEPTNGADKPKTVEFKPYQPNIASAERARFTRSARTCGKVGILLPSMASVSLGTSTPAASKNAKKSSHR